MANRRVAGILSLKINGELFLAKGEFTYNLGAPKREAIIGADSVHGYSESVQVPMIEGAITDTSDLNLEDLLNLKDATITLELANKTIVMREGWYSGDGSVTTSEAEIAVSFNGISAEEVA